MTAIATKIGEFRAILLEPFAPGLIVARTAVEQLIRDTPVSCPPS
jgi:hypothetical protein